MKTLTLDIMPHGAGWKVASASQAGTWHYVAMTPHPRCTCSGWIFGHGAPCRHMRAVKAMLVREKEVVYQDKVCQVDARLGVRSTEASGAMLSDVRYSRTT